MQDNNSNVGSPKSAKGGEHLTEEQKRKEILARRMKARADNKAKKQDEKRKMEEAEMQEKERISIDPRDKKSGQLVYWEPESDVFWAKWGWKTAFPNLVLSTFNLMWMFALWKQWGSLVGGIKAAHKVNPDVYHFGFTADEKKEWATAVGVLGGIAGLSGAVHRCVNTFMICTCGMRTTHTLNSLLGVATTALLAFIMSMEDCPYPLLMAAAILSGVGGGAFSSYLAGISYFFPARHQGVVLAIVGGLGNLGISMSQFSYFTLGNNGLCFAGPEGECDAGALGGKYLWNPVMIFCFMMCISTVCSWLYISDMPTHGASSEEPHRDFSNVIRWVVMQAVAWLVTVVGAFVFSLFAPLVAETPEVAIGRGFVMAALSSACVTTLLPILYKTFYSQGTGTSPSGAAQLQEAFQIFRSKDVIFLSMLYVMTFSSFIGYANTYPKLIKALFPFATPSDYTWMPALLGSLARVVGGVFADQFTGAYMTGITALVMTVMTFSLGFVIRATMASDDPRPHFPMFVLLHIVLFMATGFGNATVFRQIGGLLPPEQRGPMLGWTAAMAAFGGAIFPTFFGASIAAGVNDLMYYLISGYYGICMFINWRYMFWMGKPV